VDILLLKLFFAPLLVVGSTLAGRRWGPEVAGILVALPIVAGPILFISYEQHGSDFGADAAASSLLGLVALAVFAVVFTRTASRFGWAATVVTSWIVVLAADFVLSAVHVTAFVALGCTLIATAAAMMFMPRKVPEVAAVTAQSPSWDLPARAVVTGILVLSVTTASSALGPHWTGLLAPFPVATSVVAAFVHAQNGYLVTARTMAGTLMGLFSFATFCFLVSVLVRPLGGAAFVVGGAATVVVQLVAVRIRRALRARPRASI
jgi:hypothetical protein